MNDKVLSVNESVGACACMCACVCVCDCLRVSCKWIGKVQWMRRLLVDLVSRPQRETTREIADSGNNGK